MAEPQVNSRAALENCYRSQSPQVAAETRGICTCDGVWCVRAVTNCLEEEVEKVHNMNNVSWGDSSFPSTL